MTVPSYPGARRQNISDNLHGHVIADPYRWLEDANSEETRTWLDAQDKLYAGVLATLPGRDRLAARLAELLGAGMVSPPVWRDNRQFYLRREPGQEHAVLYTAVTSEPTPPGEADGGAETGGAYESGGTQDPSTGLEPRQARADPKHDRDRFPANPRGVSVTIMEEPGAGGAGEAAGAEEADGTEAAGAATAGAATAGAGEAGEAAGAGGAGEAERVLIDPMAIDPSGTTTLDSWQPDHEGRLLAYQLSEGGREESVVRVMDVATGADVDGPIDRCRYTQVAWLPGGKAFYYARRLPPGEVPAGEEQYHRRVYLHRIGTPAEEDVLIHGAGLDKTSYYGVMVSRDGRWLVIDASLGTAPRNDVWIADLTASDEGAPDLRVLQQGVDALVSVQAGRDGRLYLHTDRDAPRGRLAVADPADPAFPGYESWRDLLPADEEAVLSGYAILDGPGLDRPLLLAAWTRHTISEVSVHDLATGEAAGQVALPGLGSVSGLRGRPDGGHEAWLSYTDHATPPIVLRYDARAGVIQTWARAPGTVDVPGIHAEQVAFPSADGTTIRMLVISRAGAGPSESREPGPAILYGYGGFNVSLSPGYSAQVLAWVEAGGTYAIASLRGGSEEGEQWHRAGMREHKQNVFDDFAAASAKLIADRWTSARQLAIFGGSNGGLLVGASLTQRPQMCAAAVCSAPLLDMIRYEQFGLGQTWNDEFGTAADPEELGWLLGYSPYHHVRAGTVYPAVLFTVFDGDTRVDPLHARKMCAALQHATSAPLADRPVLLRRERDVGHGARAVSRSVTLASEELGFLAAHTGLRL